MAKRKDYVIMAELAMIAVYKKFVDEHPDLPSDFDRTIKRAFTSARNKVQQQINQSVTERSKLPLGLLTGTQEYNNLAQQIIKEL